MKIDKPYFARWLKAGLNEAFRPEDATNGKMDGRSGLEFELTVDDQKVAMVNWVTLAKFTWYLFAKWELEFTSFRENSDDKS